MELAQKAFKATVEIEDHVDEVTIYAVSMDAAWEAAETRFSSAARVTRIRPLVAPNVDRFGVTL
ncbi:host cell RNA polymerase inhibitor [Pseudomonas costantinii]|uniref:host cell RNA polymerase inhibitor n=1 Tax=Pseudomonas costantinii TaxID=168469 RepID=UPI0015A33DC0|nr:host cell RNA polymerase inhibitor [Pseudomonas costantinii]